MHHCPTHNQGFPLFLSFPTFNFSVTVGPSKGNITLPSLQIIKPPIPIQLPPPFITVHSHTLLKLFGGSVSINFIHHSFQRIPSMSSSLLLQIPKSVSLTPSFRTFISRTNDSILRAISRRRPWQELVDFPAFSRPHSLSNATSRALKNLSYFRINYLALLSGVLAFSLLSHPLSLLSLLVLVSAWLFLYVFKPPEQPLILFGHTLSNHETLASLVVATVVVIFFTSVGSLLMSATLIGGVIMCVHGAFRDPEDLFLDGQDQLSSTGLFSLASGTTSFTSASSAVRDVASIV